VVSVPIELTRLQAVCVGASCHVPELTAANVRQLDALGLSVAAFAVGVLVLKVVFALVSSAIGVVIFWRRSEHVVALVVASALVVYGASAFSASLALAAARMPAVWLAFTTVLVLGSIATIAILYIFPDGRFVPRWTSAIAITLVVVVGCVDFFPAFVVTRWLGGSLGMAVTLAAVGSAMYAQVYRYRHDSSPLQRQQTKWVVYGIVLAGVGFLTVQVGFPLLSQPSVLLLGVGYVVNYVSLLLIPLSISAAILRSHLWDIDLVISRTLVYVALTISVVGLYVVIVGSLSAAFQTRGSLVISLLATGVVTLAFQPLRERIQHAANRLLYGQRDEPYAVLTTLGQRLEVTLAPDAVLPIIVETVAQSLKLPYAAILLKDGDTFTCAAMYGSAAGETVRIPLLYQAATVGMLELSPRAPGEALSRADLRLLEDLAPQAGVAAHAQLLTTHLQRLTRDLQQARERLVTAREEERRRLRRDLHDGLGSALAALNFRAGAIRRLLASDPTAADALVVEQRDGLRTAISDIRRLVYALRPPALDELGLVAAIRERAVHFSSAVVAESEEAGGLHLTVEAPDALPALPAAVEVAAYRIVQEALANVAHHAQARTCSVRLSLPPPASANESECLILEVVDDGVGLPPALVREKGVGMQSMRERAEELGGVLVIEGAPGGGTRVTARLPLVNM
jgi:signal transduction histidine kinase